MASQHPWFYIRLVRLIFEITLYFSGNDYEMSFLILSLAQILLSSTTYAYCIYWLNQKRLYRRILIPIAAIVIFVPYLRLVDVTLLKDVPFSFLLIWWVPLLYDLWESGGEAIRQKSTVVRIIVLLIFALVRNNGIYVSAFVVISLIVTLPRVMKQGLLLLALVALIGAGSSGVEKYNKIIHMFKETVGIPLQQVAGVIYYDGEISEEQISWMDQVIPRDFIKENYDPYSADRLKWGGAPIDNDFLNSHKTEFLKLWVKLFPGNAKLYLNVYLRMTYGFWSLENRPMDRYTSLYVSAFDDWLSEEKISIKEVFPTHAEAILEDVMSVVTRMFSQGILFWIFILICLCIGWNLGWRSLLIGTPVLGNWLTIMISTPVAYQSRYVYSLPMVLPILIGILLLRHRSA